LIVLSAPPTRIGDRAQISDGATGRVIAVVNGSLYRLHYDEVDPLGNRTGDQLAQVLERSKGGSSGWRV